VSAAEDFAQYQLRFVDDIQHDYEVIRPIVLFAETMAERSRQTGIEPTVVGAKARRFAMEGMLGLVDQRLNWLQVLGTAERSQVDQRVRHQLHAIVPLLDAFKS
jgi:hypothetical protein